MPPESAPANKMLRDFQVYILTWNVVCRAPIADLRSALGLEPPIIPEALPDMYAIGFQEVSARPQHLLSQAFFEEPWIQAIRNALHKYSYVKVKHVRLQGLILTIFTKREHLIQLRGIQSTYTRTGLGGVWGNKGGVTIRLCVYGCSICFVNSHLAAHESETFQRINEYNTIIEKQRFFDTQATNILTHDYTFWFGDLNFRVDDCTLEEMKASIENNTYSQMLSKDQLNRVRSKGEAFHEFCENDITFAPTYKFQIDRMGYNFSQRKPAWTDRILYRFTKNAYENVTLDLKQHQYVSHDLYIQSDHKPVSAFFTLKVFAKPEQPVIYFLPVGTWIINQDSFAWYYTSADTELKSWDWIGLYRENFSSLEDHLGYVWASTRPTDVYPTHLRTRRSRSRSSRGSQSRPSSAASGAATGAAPGAAPSGASSTAPSGASGVASDTATNSAVGTPSVASRRTNRSPAETENAARSLSWPRNTADGPGDPEPNLEGQRPSRSASAVPPTTPPGDSTAEQSRQGSSAAKKRGEATVSWRPPSSRQPSPPRASPSESLVEGTSVHADTPPDTGNATPVEGKSCSDQGDDATEDPGRRPSVGEAAAQAGRTDSATGQDGQQQKPPSSSSERVFYRVLFGDQTLLVSGRYRLVYLRGQSDVLGMSEPFKIKAAVS
uniref:Inositol-1,4,5-trisphosphate 5-phosphatase n=1 Tax=Rhipicephalus appendiculatus TaxID=34631 RepID=A0A131YMI8_RHIAP